MGSTLLHAAAPPMLADGTGATHCPHPSLFFPVINVSITEEKYRTVPSAQQTRALEGFFKYFFYIGI